MVPPSLLLLRQETLRSEELESEVFTSPLTTADRVLFYIQLVILLSNIPIVIYIIWNRRYPPIKAKQVWLTSLLGISIILFMLSVAVMFGIVEQKGIFRNCHVWGTWVILLLGIAPTFSIINYRLIVYYRVFVAHQLYSFRRRRTLKEFCRCYWPLAVLMSPALVACIVMEILPKNRSADFRYYKDMPTCLFKMEWAYFIFGYYFAQILVSWSLYFAMRRIAKSFNEFKTVMPGLALLTISLISTAVVVSLGGAGHSWGRTLNGIVFTVILNLYWWMIVIKPVFGHMFMYDKCLKNFLEAVQDDGMTARRQNIPGVQKQLYNVDNSMSSGGGTNTRMESVSRLTGPYDVAEETTSGTRLEVVQVSNNYRRHSDVSDFGYPAYMNRPLNEEGYAEPPQGTYSHVKFTSATQTHIL